VKPQGDQSPPAGEKPKEKDDAVFSWDLEKASQFQKATGEITGTYSTVITYRETLTFPARSLRFAEQKGGFLDLRGK
jgi:hypothetical protein